MISTTTFMLEFLKGKYSFQDEDLRGLLESHRDQFAPIVQAIYDSINQVKNGYAKKGYGAFVATEIEDQLLAFQEKTGLQKFLQPRFQKPQILLSHDIDYLETTPQMNLKRLVGYGALKKYENYLSSIETIFRYDLTVTGFGGQAFVCFPRRALNPVIRSGQWLMDPSYEATENCRELKNILQRHQAQIGIHGSFFSLEKDWLGEEKSSIESFFGVEVHVGRQHWLRLPSDQSFSTMSEAGLKIDSSVGWNGNVGYRSGYSSPYFIPTEKNSILEIPLVLMDGPLFDDLKLSQQEVFETSVRILNQAKVHNGVVSVDWHDRGASPSYDWFGSYQKIVEWALSNGFEIMNQTKLKDEYGI